MSALSEMPVVTVEQVMRFRDAALDIERQRDDLESKLAISEVMYQSGCHAEEQRDELLERNKKLSERQVLLAGREASLLVERHKLIALLDRYGGHDAICLIRIDPQVGNCDCGFDAAITDAAIAKAGGK